MSSWKSPVPIAVALSLMTGTWQQPTFRSRAEGVVITVAVTSGQTPVAGLGADDFELLDRGVRQQIEVLSGQTIPLDVSLLVDLNYAFEDDVARYRQVVRRLAGELRDEDAMRLLVSGPRVAQLWPMTPARSQPFERLSEVRGLGARVHHAATANDGIAHALAWTTPAGHRHLVVALTKYRFAGEAIVSARALEQIARLGDATLYVATLPDIWPYVPNYFEDIGRAAAVTGGQLLLGTVGVQTYEFGDRLPRLGGAAVVTFADATEALARVVREFRHSYVLGYVPTAVELKGWHDVTVKVTRKSKEKYTVRTRSGYWGGGS
jgi:hypothetical protein